MRRGFTFLSLRYALRRRNRHVTAVLWPPYCNNRYLDALHGRPSFVKAAPTRTAQHLRVYCSPMSARDQPPRVRPRSSALTGQLLLDPSAMSHAPLTDEEREMEELRSMIGDADLERLRPTGVSMNSPVGLQAKPRVQDGATMQQQQQQAWYATDYSREAVIREFRKEAGWDSSVHRSTPATLRGYRPLPGSNMEPWAMDAALYANKGGMAEEAIHDAEGERSSNFSGLSDIMVEKSRAAKKHARAVPLTAKPFTGPGWNSSTQRRVPYALRGIKPVTQEPWTTDENITRDQRQRSARASTSASAKRRAPKRKIVPAKDIGPGWDSSKHTQFSLAKPNGSLAIGSR